MTDHLSSATLSAVVDGELSAEQLAVANEHLAGCSSCTASALQTSLLKSATAKAGQRYTLPPELGERLASQAIAQLDSPALRSAPSTSGIWSPGWIVAAVLLLVFSSMMYVQRHTRKLEIASAEQAALVTEVFDQHLAMLAGSLPPQVISTDRHTVKPWFQGKIPFSFNLPENLPADTTLDGANLTYLHNQPVAQLLYSIGKHRVSVFVRQKHGATGTNDLVTEHSGFHVTDFTTGDLDGVAVSDVDPARLAGLVSAIRHAQSQ
jgi:anti-sigma factor RsiW